MHMIHAHKVKHAQSAPYDNRGTAGGGVGGGDGDGGGVIALT